MDSAEIEEREKLLKWEEILKRAKEAGFIVGSQMKSSNALADENLLTRVPSRRLVGVLCARRDFEDTFV